MVLNLKHKGLSKIKFFYIYPNVKRDDIFKCKP